MFWNPRTRDEAQRTWYGAWAGNPKGYPYAPKFCAYQLQPPGSLIMRQCSRKPRYGPDDLYCKQHALQLQFIEKEPI